MNRIEVNIQTGEQSLIPLTDEEIAELQSRSLDLSAQTPDWPTFKATALGSATLNQILAAAYQSAPVAAGALTPALLRAEQGDAADFSTAWTAICAAVPVPEDVIAGFTAVATSCNLPAGFVQSLTPVRHRARNEDGTFRADDPATPENEAWA